MKNKLLSITISLLLFNNVFSQVDWTKYDNNPVFISGPAFYDLTAVGQPTVLFENDTIKMWYSAVGGDMKSRIGYAFSTDGITWTKHSDMVINTGYDGEWDSRWLDTPEVIRVDSGYFLYFYGDSIGYNPSLHYEAVTHSSLGVAFSIDGINWTKSPANPVLSKGNYGDWDGIWIESPAIIKNNITGELMMWYNGVDTITWKIQIGLATSSNGVSWTKYANNPVLQNGSMGTYDDMWMGTPAVIYKTDHYEMWYSSAGSNDYNSSTHQFDTLRICFASSDNGIDWTKYLGNPLFDTGTSPYDTLIDKGGPWAPDVIFDTDSNQYKMWFEAAGGFLLATSPANYVHTDNVDLEKLNDFNIYPNPSSSSSSSSSFVTVEFNNLQKPNWKALLLNVNGEKILQQNDICDSKFVINIKNIPKGVYFLQLSNGKEENMTKKLIIE